MTEAITFKSVQFGYGGKAAVLDSVDLDVRGGEFFCLLGPSGCGKTTLLNLVAGFEKPTGGVIRLGNSPITGPGVDRPVIFQGDDSLMSWLTAVDNVALGLRFAHMSRAERRQRARDAMSLVGLRGHEDKLPRELSGGMKQRIQIARALVVNAAVLLMDEPFAALDAQVRSILQEEVARIWDLRHPTVLFITHDITEAVLLADRVGVMSGGPGAGIREVIDIDLPRPRSIGAAGFGRTYDRIASLIRDEVLRTLNAA